MTDLIQHVYIDCAGKTLKWLDPDSQEAYKRHIKSDRDSHMLREFGWVDVDIDYKFNSHGYRNDEFVEKQNFVTLGCSFTFGVGVNANETWPHYLSEILNLPVWNLGVPGTSSDTCYRIAKHYLPVLKPEFVVMLEPRRNRVEVMDSTSSFPHIVNFAHSGPWADGLYVKKWITDEQNLELHAEKNRAAIAHICQELDIPLYMYKPDAYLTMVPEVKRDLGRDLLHAGRLNNAAFAEAIAKDIQIHA